MSVTGGGGDDWWAVILTGADTVPADHLVWNRSPRAFCSFSATASLLERAQHRAAKLIAPHRTLLTLFRAYERDYAPLVSPSSPAAPSSPCSASSCCRARRPPGAGAPRDRRDPR